MDEPELMVWILVQCMKEVVTQLGDRVEPKVSGVIKVGKEGNGGGRPCIR